jgi:hypothetical protein
MKGKITVAKADLNRMTLGEQEVWENLTGCSMQDLRKKGLSGRRLAALLFIFEKRENPDVEFEKFLNMDMSQAADLLDDGEPDPKG